VRIACEGHVPGDDALCVEPGRERVAILTPRTADAAFTAATLTAINLEGRVRATTDGPAR
jgi:hypothetical protein